MIGLPTDRQQKELHNIDAEKACLGSMMLVPSAADHCISIVQPKHFHRESHQHICRIMYELRSRGEEFDPLVISACLERENRLEDCGGDVYLMEITDSVPHAGNAAYYAREVRRWWKRRQVWYGVCDIARQCHNFAVDEESLVAKVSELVNAACGEEAATSVMLKDAVFDTMDAIDSQDQKQGLTTGFYDLDETLGGLQGGTLTLLAARPAVGKTSLLCAMLLNMGLSGVVFASLEMKSRDITERLLAMKADIPYTAIRRRKMNEWQREALVKESNALDMPVRIDDRQGRTIADIGAMCRQHRTSHPLGILMVDYLQLITPDNRRDPREQQVSQIANGLTGLAKSLDIPVLALCQLNRDIEKRENKRPRMADLRESGALEQAADAVVFLDRPATYSEIAEESEATLIVAKNRNGETKDISLIWDGPTMTFKNAAPKHLGGMEPDYWDNQ